ncbi:MULTISPECIES: amidohydrolase family protein [unclassified Diaminobutyricimonas]|uniref:amidohydrolase family protein n=1 Tax=unclassified Diaminobutyricimonas TaxID=2643261 RepID=UPI0012F4D118|nr:MULTISPECIES: amidohydrolase family protein [unclassified Diaminobutyricimonas]
MAAITASRELLIKGGHVLSIDSEVGDLDRGDILVRDGRIVEVSPEIDADVPVIDASEHFVMPGFVDSHTHMWNSLWRTVAQPYPRVHSHLGRHYLPEDSHVGVRLAALDMINGGVTTVHAWEHNCRSSEHVDAELEALRDVGIRRHYSYGYHHDFAPEQITDFADIVRARNQWEDDLTTVGFASRVAHVPLDFWFPTATEEVRQREWAEARKHGLQITHHAGTLPTPYELEVDLGGPDVLFVHAYHWAPEAWKVHADLGTRLSLSPYSSMFRDAPMPFNAIRESGIVVSLSYDHLSGPGSADTFRLMHISHQQAMAAKQSVSARELVEYATLGGAKALAMADRTGSITPGKSADIILVDKRPLGLAPIVDPYHAIVNSAQPGHVSTVMVAGRVLKHEGKLVDVDEKALRDDASRTIEALFRRANLDEFGGLRS